MLTEGKYQSLDSGAVFASRRHSNPYWPIGLTFVATILGFGVISTFSQSTHAAPVTTNPATQRKEMIRVLKSIDRNLVAVQKSLSAIKSKPTGDK